MVRFLRFIKSPPEPAVVGEVSSESQRVRVAPPGTNAPPGSPPLLGLFRPRPARCPARSVA